MISISKLLGDFSAESNGNNKNIAGDKPTKSDAKHNRTRVENEEFIKRKSDEALARLAAAAGGAGAPVQTANSVPALPILSPIRHPQIDFFVADIIDAALKNDMPSMEHPLFALKSGDKRVRKYERNGNSVIIKPGADGCATIHDKDIWIYCISQMIEAMNRGREDISRTVRFIAYDFLVTTNRQTSGESYRLMGDALARLRGTSIETNIETDGVRERQGFGLVDTWRVIEREGKKMVAVEVTLPDWLYRSVLAKQVLTLSRDYFRIRKPLDRRIYELARKHCGTQKQWTISLAALYQKSGSTAPLRNFRVAIKALVASEQLPDYGLVFEVQADMVTFSRR